MAYDIAKKTKGVIIGIDKADYNIDYAKEHYKCDNLEFILGDALLGLPDSNLKIEGILKNENFRSRSRPAKNLTTGIYLIFRGLNFEHNTDIG